MSKEQKGRWRDRPLALTNPEAVALYTAIITAPVLLEEHLAAARRLASPKGGVKTALRAWPRKRAASADVLGFIAQVLPDAEMVSTDVGHTYFADLRHAHRWDSLNAADGETALEAPWMKFSGDHRSCPQAAALLAALEGFEHWVDPTRS